MDLEDALVVEVGLFVAFGTFSPNIWEFDGTHSSGTKGSVIYFIIIIVILLSLRGMAKS